MSSTQPVPVLAGVSQLLQRRDDPREAAEPLALADNGAIDIEPAIRPATPATRILLVVAPAAATPSTRLAVETMPSLAPSTAARSQPIR